MLAPTTALRKIISLKKKIKVIQGGQGASKTFSILLILINHASSKANKEIFIVSAELSKMRITIIKDFVTILKLTGLVEVVSFTSGTLCRFPNGSFIKFLGMDKDDIGKGLRSDVVFINEANKIKFEAYRELTSRAKNVYLDFNPNSEFWAHTDVITRKDADFLKLTYKDNEFLSKEEVYEIERYKELGYDAEGNIINDFWANKWRVYGLGEQGIIDGCIFQNWKVGKFDYTLPSIYGMDFGVKDPDTLIEVALNYKTNQLYVKEHIYRSGLSPEKLRESVKKVADINKPMICDSADARMVNMLFDAGFNVFGAKKDKVIEGINALQNYDIILEPNSENLIKEFQNYIWLDRRGEVPSGDYNHCFIGDTLIETNKGCVKIEDIKVGDMVLTSKGYKPVVRKFDNGVKNVSKYSMLLDTLLVSLTCTNNHKIKTNKSWTEIQKLKKGQTIYQLKSLTEKNTNSIKESAIFQEELKDFIELFGSFIKAKFLLAIISIIKTEIRVTTVLKTLIVFLQVCTLGMNLKKELKKIQNGLKNFIVKVLRKQKNGISQKRELNGIENKLKTLASVKKLLVLESVKFAIMNSCQKKQHKDSVLTTVKVNTEEITNLMMSLKSVVFANLNLKSISIQEQELAQVVVSPSYQARVYDLMVDEQHEYFANGVLVHNCIDPLRYCEKYLNFNKN